VDLDATADLRLAPGIVFPAIEDLATYPHWLTIVGAATPAPPHPDDDAEPGAPAWTVDLQGKVGPFTRTKRVRMLRTAHDPAAGTVRFERREHDGRTHHPWILTGEAQPNGTGTAVHVHLHYGGGRSLPGADLLLRQEARKAGERLERHLRGRKLE
jgi:hypothetical protein